MKNRLLMFNFNLYYIFTGIFLLLKNYDMVLLFWVLSYFMHFILCYLEGKNGNHD